VVPGTLDGDGNGDEDVEGNGDEDVEGNGDKDGGIAEAIGPQTETETETKQHTEMNLAGRRRHNADSLEPPVDAIAKSK